MLLLDTSHMKLLILTIMNSKITTLIRHLCNLGTELNLFVRDNSTQYAVVLELYYSAVTSHFG